MLTLGRLRGLQEIAGPDGRFTMVAIDQRLSLARILSPADPASVPFELLRDVKLDLCRAFTPEASAVLIDVQYGLGDAVASGAFAGRCGLLVAVEEGPSERARIPDGWGVEQIKRCGASGVKLLVLYNPRDTGAARHQRELVKRVVDDCLRYDIPSVVESVSYGLASPAERPECVLRTAEELLPLGMDLYKAEFPADLRTEPDEEAAAAWCRRLDEVCGRTPWVILSAGVAMDVFVRQVELACRNGASGVLAGRALWQDAVREADPAARLSRLRAESVANFRTVAELVRRHATPWTGKLPVSEVVQPIGAGWFQAPM